MEKMLSLGGKGRKANNFDEYVLVDRIDGNMRVEFESFGDQI